MEFQFDEQKRQEVIRTRGVDLLYAALIFEQAVLTRVDDRHDYGETRLISLGMVADECFVVVHTEREGETRLITAWKGGHDERDIYQNHFAGSDPPDAGPG